MTNSNKISGQIINHNNSFFGEILSSDFIFLIAVIIDITKNISFSLPFGLGRMLSWLKQDHKTIT